MMSKVSGTDSLPSLLDSGFNNTQRTSSQEEGASAFAAMLQDMPAEGDAESEATAATSAVAPTVTAETTTAGSLPGAALLQTGAVANAPADADHEAGATTTTGSRESVQLFEDQLALHSRFAASGAADNTTAKTPVDDPALTTRDTMMRAEQQEVAAGKGKKQAAAADATAAAEAAAQPDTAEQSTLASQTSLLTQADRAGESATAKTAAAEASLQNNTAANSTAGAQTIRSAGRSKADAIAYPGAASAGASTGKGLPAGGKTAPSGKDDHTRLTQSNARAALTLPGFAETAGMEESGFSFANIVAQTLSAPNGPDNSPTTAAGTASSFLLETTSDPALDSVTPELLPDSATALLNAENTMGSDAWVEDTATQLSWLREQGVEKAHIRLHPEDLGSLDISITVNDGQAYVQILTSTQEARELLQNSLPNLRELLQQSGLALAEGHVAQGDAQNQQSLEQGSQQQHAFVDAKELSPQANNWVRPAAQGRTQVDYYI